MTPIAMYVGQALVILALLQVSLFMDSSGTSSFENPCLGCMCNGGEVVLSLFSLQKTDFP
jgi:hypothetical protein